ncbi:MAG TPA: condensation domain-containing protein, partial [Puia sp.]|nr:condensation domain-containing protein [Puia sp.]
MNSHLQEKDEMIPASHQQQGIWFHAHINSASYWNFIQKRAYKGFLHIDAIQNALGIIISRHSALRTNFRLYDEKLYQVVNAHPSMSTIFHHVRFDRGDDVFMAERVAEESIREEGYDPDLEHDPLIRFKVLEFGDTCFFLLTIHHIVTDAVSMQLFWDELIHYYNATVRGVQPERPLPVISYPAYSSEQEAGKRTAAYMQQEKYWNDLLSVDLPLLNLGFYGSTAPAQLFHHETGIPPALTNAIRTLSLKKKILYSSVFQTAWFIFLHKYSNNTTLAVGNVVNGRGFGKRNYKDVIGLFATRIVNIQKIAEEATFTDLLQSVNSGLLAGFQNSDIPYESLVRHLNRSGSSGGASLFQASFNMIKESKEGSSFIGLEEYPIPQAGNGQIGDNQYEIGLSIRDTGSEVLLRLDVKCEESLRSLPGLLLRGYLQVLNDCVHAPATKISGIYLPAGDQPGPVNEVNDPAAGEGRTVVDLFMEQVTRTPQAVALVSGQEAVTYRRLDERSNRIAHRLGRLGVREGTPVGICLERGPEMIAGILGILKAAGAYVPIDVQYPVDRIGHILQDTAAPVVLTSRNGNRALPPGYTGAVVRLDE